MINNISVELIEITSCSNGHLQKTTIVSHLDDEHGSSDGDTCNAILTDVIRLSFALNVHHQLVQENAQGPGASSRGREAILRAI